MKQTRPPTLMRWLKGQMLKRVHGMITCREFEDFVQDYLDGELSVKQKSLFELHLRLCRECREYLTAYQRSLELGKRVFDESMANLPEEVPEDLIRAIVESRNK